MKQLENIIRQRQEQETSVINNYIFSLEFHFKIRQLHSTLTSIHHLHSRAGTNIMFSHWSNN